MVYFYKKTANFAKGRKPVDPEQETKIKSKKKILKPNKAVYKESNEESQPSDGLTPYQRKTEKRLTLANSSREARGWLNSARTVQRMFKG